MTDSSLQVKITADVTSLQAKSAVAKAELSTLNSAVKALATQFVEASADLKGSLAPQLDAAAAKAATVKAELASLSAEMAATRNETEHSATGFGHLHESVRLTGESLESLNAKISIYSGVIGKFSELVVAGLGLEKVAEKINEVAETGEKFDKLSQETGLTTEQLSGLRVIAAQTGTSFDDFAKLLVKLPGTMSSAVTDPAGKAAQAFDAMGIKVTDTNGNLRPMGDILDEVSAKLSSYKDGANKTALETAIFGQKIGAELIPFLNELGETGLQGAIEKSNELGATWTGPQAAAAEQFESDMAQAKLSVMGITDAIVKSLLPALHAVSEYMAPTLDEQIDQIKGNIANLGNFNPRAKAMLEGRLAPLLAEQKTMDDSAQHQTSLAGGTAPGTASAPAIVPTSDAGWMKSQDEALSQENLKIEQSATSTKQANAEKLANTVQYWQQVLATGTLSAQQEQQAQDALTKAEMAQRENALSAATSAAKSSESQQTEIAKQAAEARKQIVQSTYETQVATWGAEVAEGKMTKAQEVQNEIAARDQMYRAALVEANQEAALDTKNVVAHAKSLDDIMVLTAQHNQEIAQLNEQLAEVQAEAAKKVQEAQVKAAEASAQAWQKAFQPISQAFDTSVKGIIAGTETLKTAEAKAAQSILLSFVDAEAKKLTNFIASEAMILARGVATELGLTAATTAGNAARTTAKTAADAAGKAEDVALGTAQVNSNAAKAASGAYAAVAGVPIVGPVLAPAAAATAYAAVMAFDVLSAEGGLAVPAGVNPLVQLHENETVLPAHIAQPLQDMASNGPIAQGGDTNVTNHFNLTANTGDGGDFSNQVLSTLNTAVRSGSLQKYPAIARMMRR